MPLSDEGQATVVDRDEVPLRDAGKFLDVVNPKERIPVTEEEALEMAWSGVGAMPTLHRAYNMRTKVARQTKTSVVLGTSGLLQPIWPSPTEEKRAVPSDSYHESFIPNREPQRRMARPDRSRSSIMNRSIENAFHMLDSNNDGVIDRDEWRAAGENL